MVKTKKGDLTLRLELAYFEVLKCLQEGMSVSDISKYRKVSRQSIYGILSSLLKKGLINKKGYAVYDLTDKGIQTLHSFVGLRYNLRQHNLHIKIKILESPKNWELKRNEMRQMPYFNRSIKLKNNEQDIFNYGKLQIKTTTKSLIIKLPTIYSKDWESAIIQAMSILENSIYKIESQFKIKLIKDYKSNITFISQEYAKIQDALAKLYRKENNRLYISGEDNKIWMITDFSFSNDETEFIHPNKATDDLDAISPMLNDLRKNPTTFSEVRESISGLLLIQQSNSNNIIKHQKVLDEMLITLKKIQESLERKDL
jgi:DNA-binding PadR family transcriptional regulator